MFRKAILLISIILLSASVIASTKVIKEEYYPNGNLKLEMIKLKKGIVKINQYYPSGSLFEVGYSKNGMFQGQWTRYDESGKIIATAFYQNNSKIGSWNHYNRWDESVCKVHYKNGVAVSYRKYDDSGNLIAYETRGGY